MRFSQELLFLLAFGVVLGIIASLRAMNEIKNIDAEYRPRKLREVTIGITICTVGAVISFYFCSESLTRSISLVGLIAVSFTISRIDFRTMYTDEFSTVALMIAALFYTTYWGGIEPALVGLKTDRNIAKIFNFHWQDLIWPIILWMMISTTWNDTIEAVAERMLVKALKQLVKSIIRDSLTILSIPIFVSMLVAYVVTVFFLPENYAALNARVFNAAVMSVCIFVLLGIIPAFCLKKLAFGQGDATYLSVMTIVIGPWGAVFALFLGVFIALPFGIIRKIVTGNSAMAFLPPLTFASVIVCIFLENLYLGINAYLENIGIGK